MMTQHLEEFGVGDRKGDEVMIYIITKLILMGNYISIVHVGTKVK